MPRVEPATPAMFEDVYPLLLRLGSGRPKEQWRQLVVDYRWRNDEDGIGYVLVERGDLVGFLGTLLSRRVIGGKPVTFCNINSWVVKDEYRGHSLSLLMAPMRMKDYTITNLTASRRVAALSERLCFKLLDRRVRLLFPVPALRRWARTPAAEITDDPHTIAACLDAPHRQIFADHAACAGQHVVVREAAGYSYVVFARKRHRWHGRQVPYSHIHYISNVDVFLRHLSGIKRFFLRAYGSWFLAVDERLLGRRPAGLSLTHRLTSPRYFRSDVLAAHEIDNLYSELVAW